MDFFVDSIFLKNIQKGCLRLREKRSHFYSCSFTCYLFNSLTEIIKRWNKHSILGRLMQAQPCRLGNLFLTSRIIKFILNAGGKLKGKLVNLFLASSLFISMKKIKSNFFPGPLKAGGIIITVMILTDLALVIIFQKQINFWGWFVRPAFLFSGATGLLCNAKWEVIKKTSFFIKNINISCKI